VSWNASKPRSILHDRPSRSDPGERRRSTLAVALLTLLAVDHEAATEPPSASIASAPVHAPVVGHHQHPAREGRRGGRGRTHSGTGISPGAARGRVSARQRARCRRRLAGRRTPGHCPSTSRPDRCRRRAPARRPPGKSTRRRENALPLGRKTIPAPTRSHRPRLPARPAELAASCSARARHRVPDPQSAARRLRRLSTVRPPSFRRQWSSAFASNAGRRPAATTTESLALVAVPPPPQSRGLLGPPFPEPAPVPLSENGGQPFCSRTIVCR